ERVARAHASDRSLRQLAGFDRFGEIPQRLRLPAAQTALAQRLQTRVRDRASRGKCTVAVAFVLESLAEAIGQSSHDGYSGVEAELLKGHNAGERFKQFGKARGPHAAQRQCSGSESELSLRHGLHR